MNIGFSSKTEGGTLCHWGCVQGAVDELTSNECHEALLNLRCAIGLF